MLCSECGYNENGICTNKESDNYNHKMKLQNECGIGESKQAVDYYRLTPWQFASKYYM